MVGCLLSVVCCAGAFGGLFQQQTTRDKQHAIHGLTRNRFCPNSTVCPLVTRIFAMVPRVSALMLLNTFIASMTQTSLSSSTREPTETKGLASGEAAA